MNGKFVNLLPIMPIELYKDQKILNECGSAHEKKRCTSKRKVIKKTKRGVRVEREKKSK